jgi:uncharacterized membrane protein
MDSKPGLGPWSRSQTIALLGILLLASAIRIIGLEDQSLWYDESARVFIASLPLQDLFTAMAQETPAYLPFYFLVVKPFTHPFHEATVRYPSVVFGVLAIAFTAQVGRKLLGRTGGLIAASLLALNPFHIWFSQDAGFYTLVTLAAVGSLYFFACLLERPAFHLWVGLIILTGIGLWSFYFAFVIPLVGFIVLVLTLRRNYHLLRTWVAAQAIAFVPLLPWYVFIVRRGEFYFGSAGRGSPSPLELLYTFWNFSIGYTEKITPVVLASLAFFGSALAFGVWREWNRGGLLLLLSFFLPIGMVFLMSYRLPMYIDRYLIGTLPAFLLLISSGVLGLPKRLHGVWWGGLILVSVLGASRIYYDAEYYAKEDWRGVAAHIQTHERPGDAIMPLLYQSLVPLVAQYYHGNLPYEPLIIQHVVRPPATFAAQYQRLWYIAPHYNDSTHFLAHCQPFDLYADIDEPRIRQWLVKHQDHVVQQVDLSCVSILLYDVTDK